MHAYSIIHVLKMKQKYNPSSDIKPLIVNNEITKMLKSK